MRVRRRDRRPVLVASGRWAPFLRLTARAAAAQTQVARARGCMQWRVGTRHMSRVFNILAVGRPSGDLRTGST